MSEYAPGKKLPPHLSPFYEYDEEGIAKLKLKIKAQNEEESEEETTSEKKEENEEKDMQDEIKAVLKESILQN